MSALALVEPGADDHAAELDAVLTDLARVIGATAEEHRLTAEYAPVISHVVKARRALRETFGAAPVSAYKGPR